MEKHNLQEYLKSTEGLQPVMVDDALFEVILAKSKQQQEEKVSFINLRVLKYAAAVIVVLVTVNCWSLIKLSQGNQQEQPVSASAQLVSEYNINR
jgi:predicted nucleic acid-binding protein